MGAAGRSGLLLDITWGLHLVPSGGLCLAPRACSGSQVLGARGYFLPVVLRQRPSSPLLAVGRVVPSASLEPVVREHCRDYVL